MTVAWSRQRRHLLRRQRDRPGRLSSAPSVTDLRATVQPGDVLVVHDHHSMPAWWIRLGERIAGRPSTWNHVVIAHHVDPAGTFWGIEGRPGGVGWKDLATYLADPLTITTHDLWIRAGITQDQRRLLCQGAEALLGVPYDWPEIVHDGLAMVDPLYHQRDQWGPGVPGHVVCSSMADYLAEQIRLPNPQPDQACTPADWAQLIQISRP
jgi:hypothetical protein